MKRTALKRGRKQLKRTPFKKVRKVTEKRTTRRIAPNKCYQIPDWFKSIKLGSHGRTPAQKRYWKLVSIAVRYDDTIRWGSCVSCHQKIYSWKDVDCGHYKAWAVCNGYFKWDKRNLAAQCKGCNRLSDGPTNERFGREMERRYGPGHLAWIDAESEKHRGEKIETHELVALAEPLYKKYGHLL